MKLKSLLHPTTRHTHTASSSSLLKWGSSRCYAKAASAKQKVKEEGTEEHQETYIVPEVVPEKEEEEVLTSGISRPLAEILKELGKRVPDSATKTRIEDGFTMKYIPWQTVNRIMNMHAPEWSGEVRSITYSADGKSVSVVYRVTLYGIDAEIYRESTGTASSGDTQFGDPVQKAEAMAFRRACARLGLGLHLYYEDL